MNRHQKRSPPTVRNPAYRKAFQRLDEALEARKHGWGLTAEEKWERINEILGISPEWRAKRDA
jgi:hypothetical protein